MVGGGTGQRGIRVEKNGTTSIINKIYFLKIKKIKNKEAK